MRYSDDLVTEVVSRNNIVDVIGEVVRLKRSGSEYTGLCPFHNEKTPSFSVNEKKQMYYCFGCHAGGNTVTFLMQYYNYSFSESLKILAERAGMTLPEEEISPEARAASEKKALLLDIQKKAAGFYHYRLRSGRDGRGLDYFRERGLSDETIRHFGLGYADRYDDALYRYMKKQGYADNLLQESGLFVFDEKKGAKDRFWNRVIFPIADMRGRVIGFGGRVMGDGKPKYLNSPESYLFNKRRNLYALQYARMTKEHFFILCEGYMDVIALHQAGFTNACASLGTALTEEQCSLIRRFTGEVCLLYDSDGAGRRAALRAIPLLAEAGVESRVADLSPFKDPDELIRSEGAEEMDRRLRNAENGFLFELDVLSTEYRRSDPASWTAFQHETARRLLTFREEMERENYIRAVAGHFQFDEAALKRLVIREAGRGTPAETRRIPQKTSPPPEKRKADSSAEKALLAMLATERGAYDACRELIHPQDFQDAFCRKLAGYLFEQLSLGGADISSLVSHFGDADEQSRAAAVFYESIPAGTPAQKDRVFTDLVLRLMRGANDASLSGNGDIAAYSEYIERQNRIEALSSGKLLHLPDP